jgi:hypothetical protein
MRYLALIYATRAGGPASRRRTGTARWASTSPSRKRTSRWAGASSTRSRRPRRSAVRGDETLVTDGPFAETAEAIGGYYVFECDTIDEACTWAAKIPAATHGAIEVRPVYVDPRERREEAA